MSTGRAHDVVVIGSGAGGGAAAYGLARRGVTVLLLEAGPAYDPAIDYRLARSDWERTAFPSKVPTAGRQTIAPLQTLDASRKHLRSWNHLLGPANRGSTRANWGYQHVIGLGGSTLQYTGEAHRLHPAAMKMHTRFGVAADWPISYSDLEPYYVAAERIVGVAGADNDPVRTRSAPYPLPPHPLSYASKKLGEGARKLGLSWTPNPYAALSRPYDGRPGCNYCGQCMRGCPRLDKGSVDITFVAKARASGRCTIRTESRVTRIEAGPRDQVSHVEYIDAKGRRHRVSARAVVVACGAVETPRLLLAAAGKHAPDGLANESGQVGRNFMETLFWIATGLHPEPLGSHRGLPSDAVCWDYNAPDAIPGTVGGCRFTSGTTEADLGGPIAYSTRVVGGWGRQHKRTMRAAFGRALTVVAIGESLPGARSFIDLDPEAKDADSVPRARIHSHLDERELARLEFMAGTARKILKASGATQMIEEYGAYDAFAATHVFGTCRMGDDPRASVVDRHCRSHRWRNLFVADASVFPSSGGGEAPSLTIEAIGLRAADSIAASMARRDL
jgi:choline dehydrogenase-like flavoprotein